MSSKFDILNHQVKGLTRMYAVPQCFYETNILSFINQQIDQGIDSFDKMDSYDQDELSIRMMNALGADEVVAIIDNVQLPLIMDNIKRYMKSYTKEEGYDLALLLRNAITEYFAEAINFLFFENQEARLREKYFHNNSQRNVDSVNGEVNYYK